MIKIKSYDEFKNYYYEHGRLMSPLWSSNKPLNEVQLQSKYKEYCGKIDKQNEKIKQDKLKWEEKKNEFYKNGYEVKLSDYAQNVQNAMKESKKSDPNHIRWTVYFKKLSPEQRNVISSNMWLCPKNEKGEYVYDTAHIIARSESSKLASDVKNMIEIPRAFHSFIDNYQNPLTEKHERLSSEEHDKLWIDLIGQELWDYLNKNK